MDYTKIFNEWFEFSEDDYLRMAKYLRKGDGKRRLIKVQRKGIAEKVILTKWKVDRNDEVLRVLESSVRYELTRHFIKDDKLVNYVEKYGVVNSARVLRLWTDKMLKRVLRERIRLKD